MYYLDDDTVDVSDLPTPDKVLDKLFIGNVDAAHNHAALKNFRISHILNAMGAAPPFPDDFTYLTLENLVDSPREDLLSHLPLCISFIEQALKNGNGILIHCTAGVSRSCAILAAYLMKVHNSSAEEAISMIPKARPCVQPNCGFLRELTLWGKMGFTLEGDSLWHRHYNLRLLAQEYQQTRKLPEDMMDRVNPDPLPQRQRSVYQCGHCSRDLFMEEHIVVHEKAVGRMGKSWCQQSEECATYFIEPMEWMGDLTVEEGSLQCPQCNTPLGSWTWLETECSCATVVSPSFSVQKDSVVLQGERKSGKSQLLRGI